MLPQHVDDDISIFPPEHRSFVMIGRMAKDLFSPAGLRIYPKQVCVKPPGSMITNVFLFPNCPYWRMSIH